MSDNDTEKGRPQQHEHGDINREPFDFKIDEDRHEAHGVAIKVVGVGGGGSNAISHMYRQQVEGTNYVVINTDRQSLENSPVPHKLLIGPTVTKGKGAGNMPELGRLAAEESASDIEALFDDDTSMVFITAGMGGGTGTGAGPVVARIAKERGVLTIGIITVPFLFEGEIKILKALDGADEMAKNVDALMVINNERLTEIYPDLDIRNGFAMADDTLTTAARSISEIITTDGTINCDIRDVDTTLRGGGTAIISCGYGEGEKRTTKAIEAALNSPLLKNRDILGSKRLLFNLYYSPDAENVYKMAETRELTQFINTLTNVDVIWGLAEDDTLGEKVKMTILAAGFDISVKEGLSIKAKTTTAGLPAAGKVNTVAPPLVGKDQYGQQAQAVQSAQTPRTSQMSMEERRARLSEEYGPSKIDQMIKDQKGTSMVLVNIDLAEDDEYIRQIEELPTAVRGRRENLQIQTYTGNVSHTETPERDQHPEKGSITFP